MESDERRRFRRLGPAARVTVRPIAFPLEGGPGVEVEMCDVSSGGVRVLAPVPLPEEQPVEVSIVLPGWYRHTHNIARYREEEKPLTAVGKVLRCTPAEGGFEAAIEFTDIWEDHWKAMRLHLEEIFAGTGS